jgi:polyvinyl alcohol dehydrogenase (cytochrome)
LVELGNGRRLLIAGQKSGVVHAIDPDNQGATVWEAQASPGGLMGGIEWGIASDGNAVYVPISDIKFSPRNSGKSGFIFEPTVDRVHGGGLIAFDVATGRQLWAAPPVACPNDGPGCSPAQLAAATVIPGVVFSGSMSGNMRAYSTSDGSIIWDYDTKRDYDAVGGLKGRGGTLNGPGPIIVDGVVYISSGYEGLGLSPGNVLLALSAK